MKIVFWGKTNFRVKFFQSNKFQGKETFFTAKKIIWAKKYNGSKIFGLNNIWAKKKIWVKKLYRVKKNVGVNFFGIKNFV